MSEFLRFAVVAILALAEVAAFALSILLLIASLGLLADTEANMIGVIISVIFLIALSSHDISETRWVNAK